MSPVQRIAAFLVGLVLAGGAGAALGTVVGPIDTGGDAPHSPAHEAPATTSPADPPPATTGAPAPTADGPATTHGGDHGG